MNLIIIILTGVCSIFGFLFIFFGVIQPAYEAEKRREELFGKLFKCFDEAVKDVEEMERTGVDPRIKKQAAGL